MSKWKGTKCGQGYIHQQKIFQSLMLLLFIAIGVGLFLLGLFITGTRANIFTVLGILMVLPGAKRVIALVVMLPRSSVEQKRYEEMERTLTSQAVLLTDYVFTSVDKIMSLDFVVIQNKNVIGVLSEKKQDVKYLTDYVEKSVRSIAPDYRVKILDSDEAFYKFYRKMPVPSEEMDDKAAGIQEEVVKYLKVLAV